MGVDLLISELINAIPTEQVKLDSIDYQLQLYYAMYAGSTVCSIRFVMK